MPKLRASCDACGVAKVKCDRGQPSCGRCILQGATCVYGVCRRTGKPPGSSSISKARSSSIMTDDWSMDEGMGTPLSPMFTTSQPHNLPMVSTSAGSSRSGSTTALSSQDADLFASFIHQPQPPLDFNDFHVNSGNAKQFSASDFGDFNSFASFPDEFSQLSLPPGMDDTGFYPQIPEPMELPPSDEKHQDCVKEAYEILGDVDFVQKNKPGLPGAPPPPPVQQRPLDQILHVNRKAGERLQRLLTCSCAKSPGLAMVYASAIWRILQTYQQAAECVYRQSGKASQSHELPSSRASPTTLSPTRSHDSGYGSMFHVGKEPSSSRSQISPSHISIGSFVVGGDDRVSVALSLQLLGDETRRIGGLIHLLACGNGPPQMKSPQLGSTDDLEQILRAWVKREHSKATGFIQARSMSLTA